MSRSNYNTTTHVEDRDYDDRRDRERDRARSADRYDSAESRHHGKWTATSETTELEGGAAHPRERSHPRRSLSRKDSREDYDDRQDYNRSRGSSNYGYDIGSGYGHSTIPTPPPMPPVDFYQPHGSYRSTNNYGAHPRSTGYGYDAGHQYGTGYGATGFGHHQTYGTEYGHPQTFNTGYGHHYGTGYGATGYGHGYESFFPSTYGGFGQHGPQYQQSHPSLLHGTHPIQRALLEQQRLKSTGQWHGLHHVGDRTPVYDQERHFYEQSRGLTNQYDPRHHQQFAQQHELYALGYHGSRPHVDIYELGNEYIIELDLPGHSREHIDIKLAGNELYVISKPPKRDLNWHINERALGRHHVERKFYLPADVNSGAIAPVLANGVLKLVLPRSATTTTTAATLPKTTTTTDTTTTTTATTQAVTL